MSIRKYSSEGHRCDRINDKPGESCKFHLRPLPVLHACTCARCTYLRLYGLPLFSDEGYDADELHEAFALGYRVGQEHPILCAGALLDAFPERPPAALLDGYRIGHQSAPEARRVAA